MIQYHIQNRDIYAFYCCNVFYSLQSYCWQDKNNVKQNKKHKATILQIQSENVGWKKKHNIQIHMKKRPATCQQMVTNKLNMNVSKMVSCKKKCSTTK